MWCFSSGNIEDNAGFIAFTIPAYLFQESRIGAGFLVQRTRQATKPKKQLLKCLPILIKKKRSACIIHEKVLMTNKKVIFYRYQRNTLAINHTWGKDAREVFLALPILPCHLCLQYSEYKDLMDAASHDLRNKKDGKWIYDREYGWQHHLMEPFEETACQEAVKRYRKPANQLPR